jgi:hypothetical protein
VVIQNEEALVIVNVLISGGGGCAAA